MASQMLCAICGKEHSIAEMLSATGVSKGHRGGGRQREFGGFTRCSWVLCCPVESVEFCRHCGRAFEKYNTLKNHWRQSKCLRELPLKLPRVEAGIVMFQRGLRWRWAHQHVEDDDAGPDPPDEIGDVEPPPREPYQVALGYATPGSMGQRRILFGGAELRTPGPSGVDNSTPRPRLNAKTLNYLRLEQSGMGNGWRGIASTAVAGGATALPREVSELHLVIFDFIHSGVGSSLPEREQAELAILMRRVAEAARRFSDGELCLPKTPADMLRIYCSKGVRSMLRNAPGPTVRDMRSPDGAIIAFVDPTDVVMDLFARGVQVLCIKVDAADTGWQPAVADGPSMAHTPRSKEIAKELQMGADESGECLVAIMDKWRDEFGPNATKQNRLSIYTEIWRFFHRLYSGGAIAELRYPIVCTRKPVA